MDHLLQTSFENEQETAEIPVSCRKQQLDTWTSFVELRTDFSRSSATLSRIEYIPFSLSSACLDKLKQLSNCLGTNLFTTLLSAYNTLLFRYTKQQDIVVGLPNIEYIIGEKDGSIVPRQKTKVYRIDLSGNPSFNELLNRVHQVVLNGNKYKDVPYGELGEDIKLVPGTNYTDLYNVIFSFRTTETENNKINEWVSNSCVYENSGGGTDLALHLEETIQGLNGVWRYNSELFKAVTIERISKHFEILLEGIISDPQQTLSEFPLLTEAEYYQLTLDWNSSKVSYPANKCIHELFEAQVRKTPGAIALVFEKEEFNYAELNERANQLAHYLRSKGVQKETLVPVFIDHSHEMVIGILGILKSGGAYVPIDPDYPMERVSYLLEDTGAFIAICNKESKIKLEAFPNIDFVDLTDAEGFLKKQPTNNLNINLSADNLAYIIYTSGTTGKPKGVMIEHRSLADHCYGVIQSADLQSCKSFALFSPLVFDAGHSIIHSSFILGACLHVLSKPLIMNSENVAAYLDNNSIDCIKIVPSLWLSYASLEKMVLSKKVIIFGGEVFPLSILNYLKKINYGGTVYNHYGPTEVTIGKCIHKINIDQAYNNVPIGKPFSNTQLYILDDHLQLTPIGIEGELYIGGEGLSRGYLNRSDLTAEKFIRNPFANNSTDKIYRTGDKVKWLSDGNIEYLGRMDDQVKIQGHRIELGEIEDALFQSQLIQQAVVIAHADKKGNKQLIGCVVPGKQYNQEALIAFLRKKLPEYMIPVKCIELENLPLTNNGKINKRELEDLEGIDQTFIAPTTNIEVKLAAMWQDLLNTEKISIHDNFFELGGNSVHAVFLFSKIKKEFNKSLPLSLLFTAPTIYQLSLALKLTTETFLPSSSIVPIQPNGSNPPFFCVHAGHGNVLFYANLSLNLGQDQPFYGIQAKGIDGTELPFIKMEQMAKYYLGEIRKVQPEGPYYLGGYCFGARIAFEMAQQLTREGQKVALLASFNGISPTYGRNSNIVEFNSIGRSEGIIEKISSHLKYTRKLSLKEKTLYISNKVTMQILGRLTGFFFLSKFKANELIFKLYLLRKQKVPETISRKYVAQSLEILQSNYKPKPYKGSMVVFRSPGIFIKDSYLGWKSFVKGEIKTIDIPGAHEWRRDILNEPYVQILAKELENVLNK